MKRKTVIYISRLAGIVQSIPGYGVLSRMSMRDKLVWCLRIGAAMCFWGWAWQHLRWDVPYRAVLWSPDKFSWVIELFGMGWEDWVGNAQNDELIQTGVFYIGWVG